MSLRLRLTFALMVAALLPMVVAVGVTMLRAERRAQQEAAGRLQAGRRQAEVLIDRLKKDVVIRLDRAAVDLPHEFFALETLLKSSTLPGVDAGTGAGAGLPEGASQDRGSAREIAPILAERYGLDYVQILNGDGRVLAASPMDVVGLLSPLADLVEGDVSLREVPRTPRIPPSNQARAAQVAFFVRRPIPIGNEPLDLVGGRLIDREFIEALAALSGGPSALIDGSGSLVMTAEAEGTRGQPWVAEAVPLGRVGGKDAWRVRISVPAGDVKEARKELLGVFASIAPFALVSALVVGIILAEGISRPIRGLAARAEEISAAQSGPISLLPERDEVHRLTISFDRMLDALSRSEQERISAERIAAWQEVAKRIAHEVKNPLSPIKLAVENLRRTREKAPAELDRALDEETATILEEVESLRRLVDEFSQFARLPAPQPAPCDARQIVSQVLALFAARMEAAGVTVKLDTAQAPERIDADAEQIGRVVKNVIANALDALDPVADRHLEISIRRAETLQRAWVEIEVRDTGVGFDAGVQKRIFEPYFTTRPQRGGAGLGMAIAYRIVSEHGGTIQARGAPGRGATITIRLPMSDLRAGFA